MAKSTAAPKRLVVPGPGPQARRSPSWDLATSAGMHTTKPLQGSAAEQHHDDGRGWSAEPPHSASSRPSPPAPLPQHGVVSSSPRPHPGSMARSRSLQSISDAVVVAGEAAGALVGPAPPATSRSGHGQSPHHESQASRVRTAQMSPPSTSRSLPSAGRPGTTGTAHRVSRLSSGTSAPCAASSGGTGTPAGTMSSPRRSCTGAQQQSQQQSPQQQQQQQSRFMLVPSSSPGRRLGLAEAGASHRHQDAGSGGTCGRDSPGPARPAGLHVPAPGSCGGGGGGSGRGRAPVVSVRTGSHAAAPKPSPPVRAK